MSKTEQFSLTLEQLSFERDDIPLFSALEAEFYSGDIVQIAGPNGAGKTTLLKVIASLLSPVEGKILWCGQPVKKTYFLVSLLMLGHHAGIKGVLTPLENLHWYFGLNGHRLNHSAPQETLFKQALKEVGLEGYEDVQCQHMSAGQQRRSALARLYISGAPVWLLDEPFTAIDPAGVAKLESLIEKQVERGGIVLLTSHQPVSVNGLKTLNLSEFQQEGKGYE